MHGPPGGQKLRVAQRKNLLLKHETINQSTKNTCYHGPLFTRKYNVVRPKNIDDSDSSLRQRLHEYYVLKNPPKIHVKRDKQYYKSHNIVWIFICIINN